MLPGPAPSVAPPLSDHVAHQTGAAAGIAMEERERLARMEEAVNGMKASIDRLGSFLVTFMVAAVTVAVVMAGGMATGYILLDSRMDDLSREISGLDLKIEGVNNNLPNIEQYFSIKFEKIDEDISEIKKDIRYLIEKSQ